jgi:hypothetical protein
MHLEESCDPAKGQFGVWVVAYILAVRVISIGIRSPPRRLGDCHILMLVIGHGAWDFSKLVVAMFLGSRDGHQPVCGCPLCIQIKAMLVSICCN